MKKFYESPVAEELLATAADLMNGSAEIMAADNSGEDLEWDKLA